MDVPIDVFKHSRVCYGKLWGRKVTSALIVDYGHVHHAKFEEVVQTLERILNRVKVVPRCQLPPKKIVK